MRLWHRFRAFVGGYFWLPCPVCGREFGGHEKGGGEFYVGGGISRITCPRCPGVHPIDAIERATQDLGQSFDIPPITLSAAVEEVMNDLSEQESV